MGHYRPMVTEQLDPYEVALAATISGEAVARRISREQLAERTGIAPRTMQRYLKGERSMTVGQVTRFADALGMDLAALLQAARQRQEENLGVQAE